MNRNCLVVDDKPEVLDAFYKGLVHNNVQVFTASNVKEARQMIKAHEHIKLFFIDLNLDRKLKLEGIELIREIRSNCPLSIIIVMTGYPSPKALLQSRRAGADDFFIKPFRLTELCEAANRELRKLDIWFKILNGTIA
jgi:DNA-binding NtrC family response regulator